MSLRKRLLVKPAAEPGGITPSEHFGVVLYEGDGSSSHSINGGKFGAAAYFNGSNGEINISNILSNVTDTFSFSCWFKVGNSSVSFCVFDDGGGSATNLIQFIPCHSNGNYYIAFGTEANRLNGTRPAAWISGYHHLVVTKSSSSLKLYIDGSLYDSDTNHTDTVSNLSGGVFGHYSTNYSDGLIDQVRIFTKELSSSEVSTLYAETLATSTSLDPLSEDTTDTLQVLGDSSCIAAYQFENDETDLSGNYDLTGNQIQYAAGRYGQAASFNGSSSYAQITSSPPQFNNQMSVSFWAKSTSTSRSMFFMFEVSNGSGGIHEYLSLENNGYLGTNSIRCVYNNSQAISVNNQSITDGNWHHFVVSVDSSTLKVYKDGTEISSASITTVQKTILNFEIGYRKYNNDLYFDGEIDQVRIFNKALSASEVTTLYQENSLVASYRFEGNANDDTRNYDGSASNVTYEYGLNFTPDFVWVKERTSTSNNYVTDSSRTLGQVLVTDSNIAEGAASGGISSLDTGGFTTGSHAGHNENGQDYVAWCFKANGGTTSSNTDGTITSTVQANTDAGFSIVSYTGNGSSSQSVGHSLNTAPELVIVKNLSSARDWNVGSTSIGWTAYLELNDTFAATTSSTRWNDTAPTSTVVSIGSAINVNENNDLMVMYCFHSVDGFSKFGSYTGNGSTDGPIVETGFEPAFVMIKPTSAVGSWRILDNKRNLTNPRNSTLKANESEVELTDVNENVDFLSNGFQIKTSHLGRNTSGVTYLYMAFAADPDTEAPTVAKSFSTVNYTGTASTQSITGLGFKPGLVWIKDRDATNSHNLVDIVRGKGTNVFKGLKSDSSDAESDPTNNVSSFDSDGFTISGAGSLTNGSGRDYITWAWKADDNEPTIFGGPAVAVYKFEDNANDVTGNYNATASNITYSSSGKFNKAASFNGTSSYITTTYTIPAISQYSVSVWFNISAVSGQETLYGDNSSTGAAVSARMNFAIDSSSNFKIILGNNSSYWVDSSVSASSYIDGNWHHSVITWNGTSVKLYIDGSLLNSYTSSVSAGTAGGQALVFGRPGGANVNYWPGLLDQARIYQGELKAEQVTELYNETASQNNDLTLGAPPEILISANANAGFSIVKYEGDGVSGKQVPHGLSAAPEMVIIKNLDSAVDWRVGHTSPGWTKFAKLNKTDAFTTGSVAWNDTAPSSTVVTLGTSSGLNSSGVNYIAYCFHSVSGFSKFGSYTGTGTANNSITGLGFQPDWIMIKRTDTSGSSWGIFDSVRGGNLMLRADTNSADTDGNNSVSFNSDGFTLPETGVTTNASGGTYIYAAFKIN